MREWLCNNAGVASRGDAGRGRAVWEVPNADWQWVLGVNFWGVLYGDAPSRRRRGAVTVGPGPRASAAHPPPHRAPPFVARAACAALAREAGS